MAAVLSYEPQSLAPTLWFSSSFSSMAYIGFQLYSVIVHAIIFMKFESRKGVEIKPRTHDCNLLPTLSVHVLWTQDAEKENNIHILFRAEWMPGKLTTVVVSLPFGQTKKEPERLVNVSNLTVSVRLFPFKHYVSIFTYLQPPSVTTVCRNLFIQSNFWSELLRQL